MSTIKIITIEREYGCGGSEIAHKLADRLGWKLWDHQLTEEIARRAECDCAAVELREERRDPLYYRLLKSFIRGSYEGTSYEAQGRMLDSDCIVQFSEQVVKQAAKAGECVIVGRGSQHFLRDRADTLKIFLYAPKEDKLRRVRRSVATTAEAEELVESVDRERAAFIKKYFNAEWPNHTLYHAMINTAMGDEAGVHTIQGLVETLEPKPELVH